jgi:hypothetical protein
MKILTKIILTILVAGFVISNNKVYSQDKLELSIGVGMPDLPNLKIKYGQNIQVGASIGIYTFEWYGNNVVDWAGIAQITYHFSGKSKYVEQKPWYVSGGLGFFDLGVIEPYEQYDIGFIPGIGRTINFSKKIGINYSIGLFLPLSASEGSSYHFNIIPSGNISFFIRL